MVIKCYKIGFMFLETFEGNKRGNQMKCMSSYVYIFIYISDSIEAHLYS